MNSGQGLRPLGHQRWWFCGLVFAATAVNCIDRFALRVLVALATAGRQAWSLQIGRCWPRSAAQGTASCIDSALH